MSGKMRRLAVVVAITAALAVCVFGAMQQGLQNCETCGLLSRPVAGAEEGRCPRCGAAVKFRKRAGIQRAWAFLIAAASKKTASEINDRIEGD